MDDAHNFFRMSARTLCQYCHPLGIYSLLLAQPTLSYFAAKFQFHILNGHYYFKSPSVFPLSSWSER